MKTDNTSFFVFHNVGPNLGQVLPLRPHLLSFHCQFTIMLGDSININNLCCNLAVLKKILKPLKLLGVSKSQK